MRFLAILLALVTAPVLAAPEPDGILTARVVVEDGKATISNIQSGLPDSVKQQLRPTIEQRALRQARDEGRLDDAEYTVGIAWEVVSRDGKEQLSFAFANNEAMGVEVTPAEPPPSMYSVMEPVTVNYVYSVAPDGEVQLEVCEPNQARHGDACKQITIALRRSVYLPKFVDGIARESRVSDILTFKPN